VSAEPQIRRVYETTVYAHDVDATTVFYADILGLRPFEHYPGFAAVFKLEDGGVFLIFEPKKASAPGRTLPAHGAEGAGHVAFSVTPGSLDAFVAELAERGIEIEVDETWETGGRSVYVRDPAGNSVEFVDGEAWPDEPRV
jgi:catechol 2,3-dioxygenase-like lactoylglutathione lyase family enzyme